MRSPLNARSQEQVTRTWRIRICLSKSRALSLFNHGVQNKIIHSNSEGETPRPRRNRPEEAGHRGENVQDGMRLGVWGREGRHRQIPRDASLAAWAWRGLAWAWHGGPRICQLQVQNVK